MRVSESVQVCVCVGEPHQELDDLRPAPARGQPRRSHPFVAVRGLAASGVCVRTGRQKLLHLHRARGDIRRRVSRPIDEGCSDSRRASA